MDFAFTEEQQFFKKIITDTVDRMVVPKAREIDEKDEFPWELWKEFTKLGYLGLRYPEEIGGMNADPVTAMIFYEQIARGSVGFAQSVIMNILMGTYFVYRFGSQAIKERCLYPAMRGDKVATMCFTEDQSGSDLSATRTTAVKDGNEWIINGTKMWITNGPHADFATVLATTDPSLGAKGLNFFLVEKGTPGFSPGQILDKLGCRGTITGELVFDNVRIPEENLLGMEQGHDGRHGDGNSPGGLRRGSRVREEENSLWKTHRNLSAHQGEVRRYGDGDGGEQASHLLGGVEDERGASKPS
jgi:alkylation response protein AidB-like acyl-CoA dehydrogenase